MPTIRLTQVAVDKLKAPSSGRIIYFDRLLPGFGLRITDKGAKSWVATYRVSRKPVMETFGTLAQIPRVDDARQRARDSMLQARAGTNPVAKRREREQHEKAKADAAEKQTVSHIVDQYLRKHVDANYRPSSAKETRRQFDKDVLPKWGKKDIATITRADVRRLIDDVRDRGASTANHLLAALKTFFAWAVEQEFIEADQKPTTGVKGSKNVERDRVLSDDEIVAVWSGCDKMGWPYGPFFKLLLLTAQRRKEVGQMEWSEIDLDKGIWTIPGKRAKNGKPHIVHLSRFAVEIITSLPHINGNKYVFTTTGETPVNGWGSSKASLDKHVRVQERWTLHDLRRTSASGMAQLGIAPQVVDKVLNHTAGTIKGVARIYNRYEYGDERKGALEAWARYVESLLCPAESNVVAIAKAVGEHA
jgi:integrase